jgi:hypothetical protein
MAKASGSSSEIGPLIPWIILYLFVEAVIPKNDFWSLKVSKLETLPLQVFVSASFNANLD